MKREKNQTSRALWACLWLAFIGIVPCGKVQGQEGRKADAVGKVTLAEEQLLGIVKKHETLLGQYNENPAKFEKKELSNRVQNVLTAYKAFNDDNLNDVFGYVLHGKFLREIGRYEEADTLFQKANELDPNIAIVKQQLGNYHAENGRYKEAYPYFVSAVKLDPEKAVYQYQLGAHLIFFGKQLLVEKVLSPADYDKRLSESLAEAVRLAPGNTTYRNLYAESFYDLQTPDWDKALRVWTSLLDPTLTDAQSQAIQLHRARAMAQLGRKEEAAKVIAAVTHPALAATRQKISAMLDGSVAPVTRPLVSVAVPAVEPPTPAVPAVNLALQAEVEQLRKELANLKKKPTSPTPPPTPSIPVAQDDKALSSLQENLRALEAERTKLLKGLAASRTESAVLKTDLANTKKQIEGLQEQAQKRPKMVPLAEHREKLDALEMSAKTVAKARADLAKLIQASQAMDKALKLAVAERDSLKSDLEKSVEEGEAMTAQFSKEKKQLVERMAVVVKESSSGAKQLVKDLQNELLQLGEDKAAMSAANQKKAKEIEFLNKELVNLEGKLLGLLDTKSKTERQQAVAIKAHLASIEVMKKELATKEEARRALLARAEQKTRDVQDLRKKLQDLSFQGKVYKEVAALFEGVVDDLSEENLEVLGTVEVVSKEKLKALEAQMDAVQKRNQALSAASLVQKNTAAALKAELEKNAKAGELQELEVGELKAQLADAAEKSQSEMADGKLAIVTLEKQLATALQSAEEGARATVREKQYAGKLKALEAQMDAVQKGNQALSAASVVQKNEAAALKAELEKNAKAGELQELEVAQLKAQLADAAEKSQSEMADGKLALVTLEKQLVASRGQVADLGRQLATALQGVEEGERATVREKQSGEKLEAELTKLKAEYQQAMGKMSSGNADIAKMAARSQKLEDELTAAQKLLGARDKAVAGMQKEVVRLNALAARLGQKAEQSGSTIENLEKEFSASQDGMRALAQERDQLKAENASLVEAANGQQLNATSLDNELAEQASVSALMADWALALTEDFVNQSSEVPVVVADDKKLKAALASQTELASSRSDEVKELRQQLVAAKVSLNQSEMSLRNFEKSLAVQVAGFREKEDTLRANVEKALSLKKVVEGQLAEANGQLAEQRRMLEGQKASVSEVAEELEASLGWVDLLAAELEGQVSSTEQQGRQHVEELNALKGQMEAQTKGFSGNATAMQKDLDKANALLKLSEDQRAKTEKVSAALQKSNKDLSTDLEGVRKELALATQMSSQQGDEIGELMQRSKAQAAELENKNTEIQDGKAKFKQLGDDFRRAMNEADTEGKVNAKEIAALEAKLVVARQEVIAAEAALQAPRQLPEAVENELQLVSALELLVDDLAHELTTGAERDVTLDQPSKQSQELQALQKQLVVETDRSKAMSVELQAARQTLDKANLSIAELKEANSALEKQSEVLVAGATAPLRKELLVVRAQKEELKQKLADYDKDNKHLASELKSLEDNLLTTLSQQDKNEKLSKQKVANLQADLEHARKALNVMKASFAAAPDKSTLEDFEKKAALAQVYEQQVKDIQKKYAGLLEQNAKESGDLQKQLNLMRDKYKIAEADRKVQAATVEEQAEQIVQWGTQASELSERLKVASVPDDTLVSDLQNQLKIANDNGTLLRGRLKGLEEEKIELSEQLVLVQADLGRNKQFFAEMQTRVEALDRLQPGVAIQKQLDGVRKELAGHKKAGLARLEKLKGLEDELAQTRKALEGKEASEAEFAKAYQGKLVGIIQQSHQLQQALQGARADLLKTRTEKNDALVELAQKHAASQKQVQDLQERLAQVQDQLAIRPAASSRERELLMEAMERLGKSKSTIEALGASLSATQTQNRQFAINQAQLLAQLEQAPVRAPSGPDQARVNELELALQESQTKLAQRDRDFRDIVAKMNRVLERLQLPYAPSNP